MNKLYNNTKTFLLLGALTTVVLVAGQLIGGRTGLLIAIALAGLINFVSYFFSDKIALSSMSATEVGPEHPLYQIVEPLAARAGLPMPRVYVSPQPAPNAFATGRNPAHSAVCATEGLLQLLSRNEVAAVMAHELAHVKHRDVLITTVAATMAGAISYLGYFLYFGGADSDEDDGGGNLLGGLVVMILGPLAAFLIQAAISRSREFNADTAGAEICGDPNHLATALQKVHHGAAAIPMNVNPAFNALMIAEPFSAKATIGKLFSTHPPLQERLQNLIGQPEVRGFRVKKTIAL